MSVVGTPSETGKRSRWRRRLAFVLLAIVGLPLAMVGAAFAVAASTTPQLSAAPVLAQRTPFDGRYLLAASDADMVGTAYSDGRLMQVPGAVDTLSLIELPLQEAQPRPVEIPVSNSVVSYPQIVAVSPAGDRVYVAEATQPVDDQLTQLAPREHPPGRVVTEIALREGGNATVRTLDVGLGATHLALSADGAWLAVGLKEPGRQLAILPTATLDDPATFQYVAVARPDGQPTDEVSSVFWHPSGQFLAVGVSSEAIQFFRVEQGEAGSVSAVPHGAPITAGSTFSYGQFTRSGEFYLVSDINWDRYPRPLGNLLNPPSEMLAIRFDPSDRAEHTVVSRVPVGLSAEGYALSPQEDLIVTVNMGRSYLPDLLAFWPGAQMNSLTLLSFDNETGALRALGEPLGFEGVLPEAAQFDADGDALAVAIYNERDDPLGPGALAFWNVVREGGEPRLERSAVRVELVRGPHALALIP